MKRFWLLASGNALSQLVTLAAYPLVTRLFTPEDFGVRAVLVALVNLLLSFSLLGYDLAIPAPRRDREALRLLQGGIVIALAAALASGVTLALSPRKLLIWAGLSPAREYLWIVPPAIILASLYKLLQHWSIRKAHFQVLARTRVWRSVLKALLEVGGGSYRAGVLALLLGWLAGSFGGVFQLWRALRRDSRSLRAPWRWRAIARAWRRHRDYARYAGLSMLLYNSAQHLPVFFLSARIGAAYAGQYALAAALLALGGSILVDSFSSVFMAGLAQRLREAPGQARQFFDKALWQVLALNALPTIGMALLGPWLFHHIFGAPWREAGRLTIALAFLLPAQALFALAFHAFNLGDRQRVLLGFNVLKLVLLIIWFVVGDRIALNGFALIAGYVAITLGLNVAQLIPARTGLNTSAT
jgi:O-antigen/teichoic acid export membrane protein